MIIAVTGLPGSGKSYFARRLSKRIGAGYLQTDDIRKLMIGERTYSSEEKTSVYKSMLRQARKYLLGHSAIVLDGTFYTESLRNLFRNELSSQGPLYWIEIIASEPIIRERLSHPRPDSEADFSVYSKIKAQWEPLSESHLLLESTETNIEDMLNRATEYLAVRND